MQSIAEAGFDLVAASKEIEQTPGEILEELFPFVFDAARRMSTRQISGWLHENRGIDISYSTLARALRNPEKYWEAFADSVEPQARIVQDALDWGMEDFLYNEVGFHHVIEDPKTSPRVSGDTPEEVMRSLDEYRSAVEFLKDRWFSLDSSVRDNCYRFFRSKDEEDANAK